ncbi:MAG: hypothetical protein PVI71_14780 [Desulfobacterales bacterium]
MMNAAVGIGPLGLFRGISERICCRMWILGIHCCGPHAAGTPYGPATALKAPEWLGKGFQV